MTSRNGKSYCDICNKKLCTKDRLDLYKRRLGKLKICKHYCLECFESKIEKLHNIVLKKQYNLLCKSLNQGDSIKIGNNKLNVIEAVMLKNEMENIYGFKENGYK